MASSLCAEELKPYQIHYDSFAKNFQLKTQRTFSKEGDFYKLHQQSQTTFFSAEESSFFNIKEDTVRPHKYSFFREVFGRKLNINTLFNNATESALYQENKDPEIDVSYTNIHALDPANYHIQIRKDLIKNPSLKDLNYTVIDDGKKRKFNFSITGQEILQTELGYMNAIKLERIRKNGKKRTVIWLAPEFEYIVLKITHEKRGELNYEMNIKNGTLGDKTIAGSKTKDSTTVPLRKT
jgi:hypothetical protein